MPALKSVPKNCLVILAVVCLIGIYGLVVNVNPGRLQHLQTFEIKQESASAFKVPQNSCELLKKHISGHWIHYFSYFDNISNVLQLDSSIQQVAHPITNDLLNHASIQSSHLVEELSWLRGPGHSTFGQFTDNVGGVCRWKKDNDPGRGISYMSSIGNQCGCGMKQFQPTISSWSYEDNVTSTNSKDDVNMKVSPSVRLARRFASKNQTVCFVGDSVDFQFYDGFRNNLFRAKAIYQECCNKSTLNITSRRYPARYSTNNTSRDRKSRLRVDDDSFRLMQEVFESTVKIHGEDEGEFRFLYLKHYMYAPWTYEYMDSCDVIIMNQALHYGIPAAKDELLSDTMAAITYLANFSAANDRLAIWRTSLPQHFDTPNGHFAKGRHCVAIKDEYILREGNHLQECK